MTIRGDAKHQSVIINRSIFRSNIRSFRYVAQQTRSVPKPKTCNKNWQNKEKPANECLSTATKTIKIQRLRIELESTLWMTYARRPHAIRRTYVCALAEPSVQRAKFASKTMEQRLSEPDVYCSSKQMAKIANIRQLFVCNLARLFNCLCNVLRRCWCLFLFWCFIEHFI